MTLSKNTRNYIIGLSDEDLDRELAVADNNGGDPNAVAWVKGLKAEVERRKARAVTA